jgi:hypothetical protein
MSKTVIKIENLSKLNQHNDTTIQRYHEKHDTTTQRYNEFLFLQLVNFLNGIIIFAQSKHSDVTEGAELCKS